MSPLLTRAFKSFLEWTKYVQSNPERFKPCAHLHIVCSVLNKLYLACTYNNFLFIAFCYMYFKYLLRPMWSEMHGSQNKNTLSFSPSQTCKYVRVASCRKKATTRTPYSIIPGTTVPVPGTRNTGGGSIWVVGLPLVVYHTWYSPTQF